MIQRDVDAAVVPRTAERIAALVAALYEQHGTDGPSAPVLALGNFERMGSGLLSNSLAAHHGTGRLRLIQGRVRLIPELLQHLLAIARRTASEPKLSVALAAYARNHSARAVTAGWQAPAAFWPRGALPKSIVTHSSMISAPSRLLPAHRSLDSGSAATSTFLSPPRVLRSHRRKQPAV
ncbi:hypothetical protein [Streptomyces sp. NPDC005989]|uniref:hypothetical protein n=1 Tax=Streptomyces sp. NPDC005989 TaxID=3156727 RepID=UPI0033F45240